MQYEVTIYSGLGSYFASPVDALKLEKANIAYECGELNEDCPFQSFPDEPQARCPFWHFTSDFQDKHDNFTRQADAVTRFLGR